MFPAQFRDAACVAHAIVRAASPLLATPRRPFARIGVEKSLDAARTSARATPGGRRDFNFPGQAGRLGNRIAEFTQRPDMWPWIASRILLSVSSMVAPVLMQPWEIGNVSGPVMFRLLEDDRVPLNHFFISSPVVWTSTQPLTRELSYQFCENSTTLILLCGLLL